MKKISVLLVVLGMVLMTASSALAIGEYSVGYRMGFLSKFSTKFAIGSGEGQLLLGRESSPYGDINPWRFSCTRAMADKVGALQGKYVWVKYQHHRLNVSLRDTEYEVLEIQPVSEKFLAGPYYESKAPLGIGRKGARSGRVVKLSDKGTVLKTYELVLQMGNAGNQFKHMSISDDGLYQYAIGCLKSGKMVNLGYIDQMVRTNVNETSYAVFKIEKVVDLQ